MPDATTLAPDSDPNPKPDSVSTPNSDSKTEEEKPARSKKAAFKREESYRVLKPCAGASEGQVISSDLFSDTKLERLVNEGFLGKV